MPAPTKNRQSVHEAVSAAVSSLVTTERVGETTFVNLPMIMPSGSFATVCVSQAPGGYRVSDFAFAFREIERIGYERSFPRTASAVADLEGLQISHRALTVDVPAEHLERAICDVATASWRVVDKVYSRISDRDEAEMADELRQRLASFFGPERIQQEHTIQGASHTDWDVSAIINLNGKKAVFHAVSNYPNAVYKASTLFHDLSALERPPSLVAVVRSKMAMGHNLSILAQAGRIIEEDQSRDVYLKAAA
ncbi:hypothetical protein [Hyphococcus sp.]|jgi:hypothetical protein|uniref:hypothetical protein n=1 Tax=Hyphococcus sp. TaxID=2038636 RepID=UPI003D14A077